MIRRSLATAQFLRPAIAEISPLSAGMTLLLGLLGLGMELTSTGPLPEALLAFAFAAGLLSPVAAMAATVAAIPFIYHPVAVAGGQWSLLELSLLLFVGSVSLRVVFVTVENRSLSPLIALLRPWTSTIAALVLLVAGAVSWVTVADPRYRPDSLRAFRWTILEPLALLVGCRWAFRRPGARLLAVAAFLVTGVAVSLAAGLQLVLGRGVVIADNVERATGPYPHPNNLALYLDRVALLALALAICLPRMRRLLAPIAVITAVGVVSTLSRGSVLGCFAAAGCLLLIARVRHGWKWLMTGGAAAMAAAVVIGPDRLTDRGSAGTRSSRELIWHAAVRMLRDHPMSGVGLDQFLNQYNRRYVSPAGWPERYTSHPHNILLDFWLSLGIAGLITVALLVLAVLWQARRAPAEPVQRAIWAGALAALIAGAVHGLVDNGYFLPDLAALTWFLISLLESTRAPLETVGRSTQDG